MSWLKVEYKPEPYDCFGVVMKFESGPVEGNPITFGLGPEETMELISALVAAFQERTHSEGALKDD